MFKYFCFSILIGINIQVHSQSRIELENKLKSALTDKQVKNEHKLVLFRDYILETLYENPYESFPDLKNYLELSIKCKDTIRIAHAYHCLAFYARQIKKIDQAKVYIDEEYNISKKFRSNYYLFNSIVDYGVNYEEQGNYVLAEKKYREAIKLSKQYKVNVILARAKINLGNLYRLNGSFQKSLIELNEAKNLCEKKNIVGFLASVYFNLGDINTTIKENIKALNYYEKAIHWSNKRNNNNTKIQTYIAITRLYLEQPEDFQKASDYLLLLRKALIVFKNPKYQTIYNSLKAYYFMNSNQLNEAELYAQKGLKQAIDNSPELAEIKTILAEIYFKKKQFPLSINMLNWSYPYLKKSTNINLLKTNCFLLYQMAKKQNQHKKALAFFEEFNEINEKIKNTEQVKLILKKQLESEYLNKQQLQKIETRSKINLINLQHRKDVKIKQNFIISLVLILLLSLLSTIYIYKAFLKNKKQKAELERLDKLNKHIFSIISHDFNTPLISLNSLIKKIDDFQLSKENLSDIGLDLKQQIERTNSLLTNLMNWSKSELSVNHTVQYNTNFYKTLNEVLCDFSTQILVKEIKVVNTISEDLILMINPDLLKIIIRNVISNAIKYSYHGEEITFTYDESKKTILISDEGIGIEKETKQKLLSKPVYSKSGTANESGFGIGLYICSELLRKIDWQIMIESEGFDQGATIKIIHV